MDYRSASAEDFSNDAFFIEWVLNPNEVTNKYWTDFQNANPKKTSCIEEAREFVLLLNSDLDNADFAITIQQIKKNIDASIRFEEVDPSVTLLSYSENPKSATSRSFKVYWAAASVVLLLAAGLSGYYFFDKSSSSQLAVIEESQTKLEAPRGKRSFVTLPDGTNIWLNADSHLKYDEHFNTLATREVYLDGEAFFDVAENKAKPFIVHTSHISIKVLGTAFNVRSFDHDPIIETTLVRGRVAINSDASPDKEIALLPSEQAVFRKDSKELILQHHIETDNYTSWKQGELIFDEKSLTDIVKDLERWYDVKIHMENLREQSCSFSGRFKNEPLEEVLELFKSSDDVRFEIKDRDVYITGNPCNN